MGEGQEATVLHGQGPVVAQEQTAQVLEPQEQAAAAVQEVAQQQVAVPQEQLAVQSETVAATQDAV